MKKILPLALIILASCQNNTAITDAATSLQYANAGDSIVNITADSLRNTLLRKIGEEGFAGAMRFCKVNATDITSSLSQEGISIGRVSDKPRNVYNEMNERDKLVWTEYSHKFANNDSLRPALISEKNEFHFYKPIYIQQLCLNCHGVSKKDIPDSLIPVLDSLYPQDRARSYKLGDLRGMWHVTFKKDAAKEGKKKG